MPKKIIDTYHKVQAETASPAQRVIMVYAGIVKNLKLAINTFNETIPNKFEIIHNAVQLSEKLILELQLALDKENGGEIAKNLESLYTFWRHHLSDANIEKSPEKIKEVLTMVEELHKSWIAAEKKIKTNDK